MAPLRSLVDRHPIATFFAASVGLGWLLSAYALVSADPLVVPLVAMAVSFVPAGAAWLVLRASGTSAERQAWRARLTRVRVGWRWYAVALFALPLTYLAGIGIATVVGGTVPFHPQALALFPLLLLTNFGEEVGWRGYALPTLQDRMRPLPAALLVGVMWGAFHWVALSANADAPLAYVAVSTIQLIAISVIMTFVFNGSHGAVPLMAVMHATYDTVAIGVSPLVDTGVALMAFSLTAVTAWVVAAGLIIATGTSLGGLRMRLGGTPASA
jgi:CAAX protease family protein